MPTTIDSAGIIFNDASTITSANTFIAKPASPSNGQVLGYNGSTWTGTSLSADPSSAKAWVNFNGTLITSYISATYSQSGTTVTITANAHGFKTGDVIYNNIGSGTAVDGTYTITGTTPNTFTYTAGTSLTTSGNCTIQILPIRSQYNISSVTKKNNGVYILNFLNPLSNADYSVVCTCSVNENLNNMAGGIHYTTSNTSAAFYVSPPTVNSFGVYMYTNNTGDLLDARYVSVQVFGN